MQFSVLGAGAMGAFIARELARSLPQASIVIIDVEAARAEALAARVSANASGRRCDARDTAGLAALLRGSAVTINAAQYDVNVDVMRACLAARCNYLDLGGMFHTTRRQLELSKEFEDAGLTAVLGMGAAPGMTNVLARAACDLLDTIERIDTAFAAAAPDAPAASAFVPPYSIRTIMQEFCEESVQFMNGEYRVQPPLAGRQRIVFPAPIGAVDCVFTLHSEPATLPQAYAGKAVRDVTWRLGLPPALEDMVRAFAAAGLGGTQAIAVSESSVVPVDFLASCIAHNVRTSTLPTTSYAEFGCLRAEVSGKLGTADVTVRIDCSLEARGAPPDVAGVMTGTPAAQAAIMIARGEASLAGAHGPESLIPPTLMFERLRERGFVTTRTQIQTL